MKVYVAVSISMIPPTILVADSRLEIHRLAFQHKTTKGDTLYIPREPIEVSETRPIENEKPEPKD